MSPVLHSDAPASVVVKNQSPRNFGALSVGGNADQFLLAELKVTDLRWRSFCSFLRFSAKNLQFSVKLIGVIRANRFAQFARISRARIGNSSGSCESAWRAIKIGCRLRMIRPNWFARIALRIARATKLWKSAVSCALQMLESLRKSVFWALFASWFFPLRGPGKPQGRKSPTRMGKHYKIPLPGPTPEKGENCPNKG